MILSPCCDLLSFLIDEGKMGIRYQSKYRSYALPLSKSKSYQRMVFCFCCGKKLPSTLYDEWKDALFKEYGLDDPYISEKQEKLIPAEFQTDEWWKKRGL